MKKDLIKQIKAMQKAENGPSYFISYNVPEPGYFECNWCGFPTLVRGLCSNCEAILKDLEEQLKYETSK